MKKYIFNNKENTKYLVLCIAFIYTLLTISQTFAVDSVYVWSNNSSNIPTSSEATLNFESESVTLIDANTGKILFAKNEHAKLHPASVTKIMSILLIMEKIDNGELSLTDTVSCSENASNMGGSQIWLDPRETLTVEEMLKAICVVSANDCVVAMAEYIAGSEEAFVQMMNDKAKTLGMTDTNFVNCHGLDDDNHLTSSHDIALMSKELMHNHPSVTKYTTIWTDTLRDGKSSLTNTNKLLRNYSGITGLKTGSTSLALYNLSASATRYNLSLIAVVMKAPSPTVRFNEAAKLLDYGFANYSYKSFAKKGDFVSNINIAKGIERNLNLIYEEDFGVIVKKGKEGNIKQTVKMSPNISAPINSGDPLGTIELSMDNELLGTINIVSSKDVPKISFIDMCSCLFSNWFNLQKF